MHFEEWLKEVVEYPLRHAKWLNTLSYLENCGARKIAACEHPTYVKEEMLKHAAEEFRHALHLKKQIYRLGLQPPEDFQLEDMLGGRATWNYLNLLDIRICRYLRQHAGFHARQLKEAAYVLVTYAIELRAAELYCHYDVVLHSKQSKVSVKAIIHEEQEHLQEMQFQITQMPNGAELAAQAVFFENQLYQTWLISLFQTQGFSTPS